MDSTDIGYKNKNGQLVIRKTDKPGTDHLQYIYVLRCNVNKCGYEYGVNGTDIFERKCPKCQGGLPGLSF